MLIYTDGIERSGNVFLSYAISLITSIEIKSTRSHQIETLIGYKEPYPFVVPVRDALACIASSKIYRDKSFLEHPERMARYQGSQEIDLSSLLIENIIKKHLEYTKYLIDHPKFFIAPFDVFTKKAETVMIKLSNQYPQIILKYGITNKNIRKVVSENKNVNVFDTEEGHLPRPTPKKEEMEQMLKSQFSQEIQEVQNNVDKLHKRYDDLP